MSNIGFMGIKNRYFFRTATTRIQNRAEGRDIALRCPDGAARRPYQWHETDSHRDRGQGCFPKKVSGFRKDEVDAAPTAFVGSGLWPDVSSHRLDATPAASQGALRDVCGPPSTAPLPALSSPSEGEERVAAGRERSGRVAGGWKIVRHIHFSCF